MKEPKQKEYAKFKSLVLTLIVFIAILQLVQPVLILGLWSLKWIENSCVIIIEAVPTGIPC